MSNLSQKGIAHLFLILILLIAGIGLGVYLIQNRTNILPRAASGPIAPRTAFSFQANTNFVQVGVEFNVDVIVSSDFDAANTFSPKIVYDPAKLEVVKIAPDINDTGSGPGYFIKKWIEQTNNNDGTILLSGAVPNPGFKTTVGTPGKMATITLKAKTVGQAAIGYDFSQSAIYRNSDNQNILTSTDAWGVNITAAPSGIPNVDSDKDGFLDGEELFYGTDLNKACGINAWPPDLNNDSFVNGQDVSALVPYTSGSQPYSRRYDLNRDNVINESDAAIIQKYFLKSCIGSSPFPTPISTHHPSILPIPTPTPTPVPLPVPIDGKRADLYKDPRKPNFVNDQDVSVFFSKCAEKGVELFGKPASIQPICDINNDGTINVPDWSVLIKYRNKAV